MSFHLFAAVLDRKGYIVGDANANSGLHYLPAAPTLGGAQTDEGWRHVGWNNVRCFGFDFGRRAAGPSMFIAGGNGVLRSQDLESWRVTTDWRVTEVLDVVVLSNTGLDNCPRIIAATAYGPIESADWGETWSDFSQGLSKQRTSETYCQVVRLNAAEQYALVGTEYGLFRRDLLPNSTWQPIGPRDVPIRSIALGTVGDDSSERWYVGTDGYGLLCGSPDTWETRLPGKVIYATAVSTFDSGLVAACGYDPVLWISKDGGAAFEALQAPDANISFHAACFDPLDASKLWVGTTDAGVFRVDVNTGTWEFMGLADASIRKLAFVPAAHLV